MAQIKIFNLTFAWPGSPDDVFENVSLTLDTDWKLGLVGRNGRGKTTFLKLLAGGLKYQGSIQSAVSFAYFPYTTPAAPATRDELRLIMPQVADWQLERELALLDVKAGVLERPLSTLSPGERAKVLLAALFAGEERFLLIDEPTNHMDAQGRRQLGRYLSGKKGFILVSHDREILDACTDHTLSINRADITLTRGSVSVWLDSQAKQEQHERDLRERLLREARHLQKAARQTADWSDRLEKTKIGGGPVDRGYIGHKSAKMMKRAKATEQRRERALAEKETLLKNAESAEPLKMRPLAWHSEHLVDARGLSIRYGNRVVCGPLDFYLRRGERVALVGKNGSGKSSLLKLLSGEAVTHEGGLRVAVGLKISLIPQDTAGLSGSLTDLAAARGAELSRFFTILRKLDFPRELFDRETATFSEGQKKKTLLALSLCEEAHLYLWDEPLNYIDMLSRVQIEDVVLAQQPTILFVEHDAEFVRRVATRRVELL
jgi:lincosamide and streptogramin A transport system ATP-binding/permease protein